nr:MAG TPA: hypothetical protein [Caudoviricetes sp.]
MCLHANLIACKYLNTFTRVRRTRRGRSVEFSVPLPSKSEPYKRVNFSYICKTLLIYTRSAFAPIKK